MGFSRQEYRNGFPFPPPGNVPHPRNKPVSPVSCISRQILYQWATWEAKCFLCLYWVDIMISSLFSMSVLSYLSWFSYMKQTLYFWNIINFVIMFYVLFYILMSQFPNALRFYLNMIQGIPKYSLKVRASLWWSQWYDSGKGVQNCSGYLEGSGPRSKLLKQLQFGAIWWLLSTLTIYNAEW